VCSASAVLVHFSRYARSTAGGQPAAPQPVSFVVVIAKMSASPAVYARPAIMRGGAAVCVVKQAQPALMKHWSRAAAEPHSCPEQTKPTHGSAVVPTQVPPWHASLIVLASPSSQPVPSALSVSAVHTPAAHAPASLHGPLGASHVTPSHGSVSSWGLESTISACTPVWTTCCPPGQT
jgi:hypothetical protein